MTPCTVGVHNDAGRLATENDDGYHTEFMSSIPVSPLFYIYDELILLSIIPT